MRDMVCSFQRTGFLIRHLNLSAAGESALLIFRAKSKIFHNTFKNRYLRIYNSKLKTTIFR